MRVRRFICDFESPLRLRASLLRLRHHNKHPFLALLRLFLPLPYWHFRVREPVAPKLMLDNLPLLSSRMVAEDITNMRSIPVWRARDTPLRTLYRIYEALAARHFYAIGPEVEYFWYQTRRSWAVQRIPDPRDPDPVRYAILACIAEELAEACNWRLSLGMRRDKRKHIYRKTLDDVLPPFTPETAPAWTRSVPAIDATLVADLDLPGDLVDSLGRLVLEAGGQNPIFAERSIVTDTGHFFTI